MTSNIFTPIAANIPALHLRRMLLKSFRCHLEYKIEFGKGINLIHGANGSGKTSLLESVQMMANGTSFRRSRTRDLVHWQHDRYLVRGDWHRYGLMNVEANGNRKSVVIALQGRQVSSRKTLHEYLAVVTESPQAERLVDGTPKVRRHWLDRLLLSCSPLLRHEYTRYGRALLQRARLVRQQAPAVQIEPWNLQLVRAGYLWMEARERLLAQINALLAKELWLGSSLALRFHSATPMIAEAWLIVLRQQQVSGKPLKIGPHCDALQILRDDHEIHQYGSHGQQRVAAVALRLVECQLQAMARHLYPVLMLDDCFDALDEDWRHAVLDRLAAYPGQVLLTAPGSSSEYATNGLFANGRQFDNRLVRLTTNETARHHFQDRCNGVDG
ncbi:MAG: DNA replication and repair protein RecF [Mariprofundales bacterium]|nr:DNA replication and repair protein RecF [Mariprofundales bacterium]